jgi:hypothetical protein
VGREGGGRGAGGAGGGGGGGAEVEEEQEAQEQEAQEQEAQEQEEQEQGGSDEDGGNSRQLPHFDGMVLVEKCPDVSDNKLQGKVVAVKWAPDDGNWVQGRVMKERQRSGKQLKKNYTVRYIEDDECSEYYHVLTGATYRFGSEAPLDSWVMLERAGAGGR